MRDVGELRTAHLADGVGLEDPDAVQLAERHERPEMFRECRCVRPELSVRVVGVAVLPVGDERPVLPVVRHRDLRPVEPRKVPVGAIHAERREDPLVAPPVERRARRRLDQESRQRRGEVAVVVASAGLPLRIAPIRAVEVAARVEVPAEVAAEGDRRVAVRVERDDRRPIVADARGVREQHAERDRIPRVLRVAHREWHHVVNARVEVEQSVLDRLHHGDGHHRLRDRREHEDRVDGGRPAVREVRVTVGIGPRDAVWGDDSGDDPGHARGPRPPDAPPRRSREPHGGRDQDMPAGDASGGRGKDRSALGVHGPHDTHVARGVGRLCRGWPRRGAARPVRVSGSVRDAIGWSVG